MIILHLNIFHNHVYILYFGLYISMLLFAAATLKTSPMWVKSRVILIWLQNKFHESKINVTDAYYISLNTK